MSFNTNRQKIVHFFRQIVVTDAFFYIFLGLLIIGIGQTPILIHKAITKPGFYYPHLDKIAFSDFYYPAIVRYGMGPEWLTKIPYVYKEHSGSLIQVYFILLGKIASFAYIGPSEMVALFRIIGGIVLLAAAIYLIQTLIPKKGQRIVFLIFLLSQPLPYTVHLFSEWYGKWTWHFGEAVRRISLMPSHYTIGKGLMIASVAFLIRYIHTRRIAYILLASICIFIAGIIYPPPVFIILVSLFISGLIWGARRIRAIWVKREIGEILRIREIRMIWEIGMKVFPFIIFFTLGIIPLLILKNELSRGYPWNMWSKTELGWNDKQVPFEWEYIHMLGWLIFLLPFSIFSFIKSKQKSFWNIFLWVWLGIPFLFFPLASTLQLGKFRFTEGAGIVPLSILAYYGLVFVSDLGKKLVKNSVYLLGKRIVIGLFFLCFLFYTSGSFYESTVGLLHQWSNIYFWPQEQQVMTYLNNNAGFKDVVLADNYTSNYLPAFARIRTILGFSDMYERYDDFLFEENHVESILKGVLSADEVKSYFKSRGVTYVYYKSYVYGQKLFYPGLLEKVSGNEYYELYKVK